MLTIERLLTMTNIKSLLLANTASGKGLLSPEDALGILARVQLFEPLGLKVLEAKVAGNDMSRSQLVGAASKAFFDRGYNASLARGLGYLAVYEVCAMPRCECCHGVGERYSKKFNKMFECQSCNGTGKVLFTKDNLSLQLSAITGTKITEQVFTAAYYDDFMDIVDRFYDAERAAAKFARMEIDQTALEMGFN